MHQQALDRAKQVLWGEVGGGIVTNSAWSRPDLEAKLLCQQEAEGKEFCWNQEDVGEL